MLLPRPKLHILGINTGLESNRRPSLASAKHLGAAGCAAGRAALFCVLVVEGLADMSADILWREEALVEPLGLGTLGETDELGGHALVIEVEGLRSGNETGTAALGQMRFIIQLGVEFLLVLDTWGRVDEEELSVDVVFEDISGCPRLIWLTKTLGLEASSSSVSAQQLLSGRNTSASFFNRSSQDLDAVNSFQEWLRNSLSDQTYGSGVLAHLVDGQHALSDEIGLCGGEVGEYETRAIAQDDPLTEVDGLEVLGFSWR